MAHNSVKKNITIQLESSNEALCLFCLGTKITRDLLLRPQPCRHCFKEHKRNDQICCGSKIDWVFLDE